MVRLKQDCCRRVVMFLILVAFVVLSGMAEAAHWSFAMFGDQRDQDGSWGVNAPVIKSMVKDIESRGVSLALIVGDQIHGVYLPPTGSAAQASLPVMYQHWRVAMGRLLSISYPVRGNHETCVEISTRYSGYGYYWQNCILSFLPQIPLNGPDGEKGMTYSFSKRGALFIGMDNFIPGNENRVNQSWLDKQLSANILPHVFVFGHEPAVALDPYLLNMSYYPRERDAFWESLSGAGVQIYACGHHHFYNRATISLTDVNGQITNPITQLVVGGGGASFESWDQHFYPYLAAGGQPPLPAPESVTTHMDKHQENQYGYSIVTVNGNQVSITYYAGMPAGGGVPTSWEPFDTFDYTVTSKTLGLKDLSQAIDPEILTNFYPGIAINKIGTGTLTLNAGISNYSEPITVSAGMMSVHGTYAGAPVSVKNGGQATLHGGTLSDVTVDAGGNLVGPGTVGDLTNSGYFCPDLVTGPWSLKVTGGFTQTATGNLNVDIASALNYGRIPVKGTANLSGDLYVTLQFGYCPAVNQSLPIITADGGLTGTFDHIIPVGYLPPNLTWKPIYTGNSFSLQLVPVSS